MGPPTVLAQASLGLYTRLLRLHYVRPSGWQRAMLGEGSLLAAGLVVLADRASAWLLLALPVGVALVVKSHDLLARWLDRGPSPATSRRAG